VDWQAGTVRVKGTRGRVDRLPLPVDVGEALVTYLRRGRPSPSIHRELFLAVDAPHGPIGPAAVSSLVAEAMRRAGITSGAAHRLRHTAAMNVVASGGGLVEAGQLLRHSSVAATAIYARADIVGLAVLARPWPGASA
jgi:integrase